MTMIIIMLQQLIKIKIRFPGGHLDKLEQLGGKFDNKCDRCVVRGAIFSSWCLEGTYDDD